MLQPPVPATSVPGNTSYFVSQTSAAQCEGARAEIVVTVHPDADAQFTFSSDTACWPFVLPIQNTSIIANNGSYNWYADNILIATTGGAFPGYTITNPSSSAMIKLVAISAFGCKPDSMEHRFRTYPKPAASFTASVTAGCGPLSVTFQNTTPLIDTFDYAWDFGNGQFSNAEQPGTIIFDPAPSANDTTYIVKLRAFNSCDTSLFTINIQVASRPRHCLPPTERSAAHRCVFFSQTTRLGAQAASAGILMTAPSSTLLCATPFHTCSTRACAIHFM
jgi:hypothetical protein